MIVTYQKFFLTLIALLNIEFMRQRSLFALFFLLFSCLIFGQTGTAGTKNTIKPPIPNTYALIVGVSNYQYPDQYKPLDWADRDGREFYNYLIKSNRGAIKSGNIDTLFNEQATSDAILLKLIEIKEKLKEGDLFYFYFSGHGDAINSEAAYLLAYDAPPGRGGKEKNHYLAGRGVIEIYKIKLIFKMIRDNNVRVVFISDACRTNELAGGEAGKQSFYRKVMDEDAGEIRFTSCAANQKSFEGPQWGGGRGLFSYHFINGLTGLADSDNDGKVTVKEIDRYVTDMVESDSKDQEFQYPQQTPELGCSIQYCEYQILNYVDPGQKAMLVQKMQNLQGDQGLVAAKGKGIDLTSLMRSSASEKLYQDFTFLLRAGNLTGPESAHSVYLKMLEDKSLSVEAKTEVRRLLCTYLNNAVNKVIFAYLDGSLKYREYSKEYFLKVYDELKLYAELSELYEYNKKQIDANLLFLKGHSYYESERTSELLIGLSTIDSAIAINPDASYLFNIRARYLFQLHRYSDCLDALQHALELAPNWVTPLTNKGVVYGTLGNYDSSFIYIRRSLELDTNYISTYKALSDMHALSGDLDSAIYLLDVAIQKDPLDADLYSRKGDLLYRKGQKKEAIALFYNASSLDSQMMEPYQGLLRYHLENEAEQDSLNHYFTKIIFSDTSRSSSYRYLARILCDYQIYDMANTYYGFAYSKDPQNTETFIGWGDVYVGLGYKDTALMLYEMALELDSTYALVYNRIGNLYYNSDNLRYAINSYLLAHQYDSWNPVYTHQLGKFYMEDKDYGNARIYLEKHLQQYLVESDSYLLLAECCAMVNDIENAIMYIELGMQKAKDTFNYNYIKKDPLLKNLKKDKRFKKLLKKMKS